MKIHHSFHILVLAGVFVCGVQARCDQVAMAQCVVPFQKYATTGQSGLAEPFDIEELNNACGTFETVNICVKDSISSCDRAVKTVWAGVDDTFTYLCSDDGKAKIQEYNPCYEKRDLQAAVVACNRTFTQETNRIKTGSYSSQDQLFSDLCRVANTFLTCATDTVERYCSQDAANWNAMILKKALQPAMNLLNCPLVTRSEGAGENWTYSESHATVIKLNTALLLASLMIYFIKY